MSGQVHQLFAGPAATEAAWDRYAELAKKVSLDPTLLSDRGFMERLALAEAEWKRLFMAQRAGE